MNRSFYLLLHSCGALLDELLGDAGAAASGTDGESFGFGQQLVVGHGVTVRPNRAERLISS